MALEVNASNFEQEVLDSALPVLVDFFADWCGPCKMMSPVVDQIGEEMSSKIKVCKCNVDDNGAVAEKYNVMSIPNFIIFKDGKPAANQVGAVSPAEFKKWIEENI
ncbi:MAG: thioredoxin [Lachnospiraceae bacterium]|nr:thioredoxin [Lachnospiraceae bacterium]